MGKIKFTALVDAARGALGNAVFSANKSGNYFRNNFLPANPNTQGQSTARAKFGAVSQAWRALTEAQRNAWKQYAPQFQQTDVFGAVIVLSGFQLFSKLNNSLTSAGYPLIQEPPRVPAFDAVNFEVVQADTEVQVTWNVPGMVTNNDYSVVVYGTMGKSVGRGVVSDSEYRLITVIDTLNGPNGLYSIPAYNQKFGALVPGTKVFFKVEVVDGLSGWRSTTVTDSFIVV